MSRRRRGLGASGRVGLARGRGVIGRAVWLFMALAVSACGLAATPTHRTRTRTNAKANPPARATRAVTFVPIDGGPGYFARKSPRSAWMDGHILLGAWLEQPTNSVQVRYDAAMGDNIYWNYAGTPGSSRNAVADYNAVRAGGMHVSAPTTDATTGSETVGRDGNDESDMNFGPGSNGWDGNGYSSSDCRPPGSGCGYTVDSEFYNRIAGAYAVHQGYGKGVLFWEPRQAAARFMNYSDILSADSYWITDDDLQAASQGGCALLPDNLSACGGGSGALTPAQSHLPANYQYDVTRLEQLQALNGASKPVVVDVETGCPFSSGSDAGNCATPPQTIAAAWHALIAGARGIIWFQHNFSGPCRDLRTLIDGSNPSSRMYNCQQTPGVTLHRLVQALTGFNHEVASLNDVLLSPTAKGYVSTSADVSTLAKVRGGACYVFAGSGKPASPPPGNQTAKFALADSYTGPVSVYDENRTVQATNGVFSDTFADGNTVHVYTIRDGATCAHVGVSVKPRRVPRLVDLRVRPRVFRAARTLASRRRGATIRYSESEAATTTFAIYRVTNGVIGGHRCVARSSGAPAHGRRCTRYSRVPGGFRHTARAGATRVRFTGWVGRHKLGPGAYRLAATPRTRRGVTGATRTCRFRIRA